MAYGLDHLDLSNPFGEPADCFEGAESFQQASQPFTVDAAAKEAGAAALARAAMMQVVALSYDMDQLRFSDVPQGWMPTQTQPASQMQHLPAQPYEDFADLGHMNELPPFETAPPPSRLLPWNDFEDAPPPSRLPPSRLPLGSAMQQQHPAMQSSSLPKSRSLQNLTDRPGDAMVLQPVLTGNMVQSGVRRIPTTLFGGKTEMFSTVVDYEHCETIVFQDLINRDKPVRRSKNYTSRPDPRPSADFRANEAWQRAYAIREQEKRATKPQRLVQEKPCVSVRASSAPRAPRAKPNAALLRGSWRGVPATVAKPLSDQERIVALLAECGLGQKDDASGEVLAKATRTPPQQPTPTPEQRQAWAHRDESFIGAAFMGETFSKPALPPVPVNARGGGVPPPVPGSPGVRSRSLDGPAGIPSSTVANGHSFPDVGGYSETDYSGTLGVETAWADRGSARPPPTHDHQLQEMQRLLGETWRYQQMGTAVTSGSGSTQGVRGTGTSTAIGGCRAVASELQGSPVQFSGGGDARHRAPPPICSDLVEVGGTEKQMTDPYVFLGRLVATLPEEAQAGTSRGGSGPCQPQAVVECNFWQLRDALADSNTQIGIADPSPIGPVVPPLHPSSSSHAHTFAGSRVERHGFPTLVPPPSAPAPWPSTAGVHGVPAPMGLKREEHGPRYQTMPPWPHSTMWDRDAKIPSALPPWPHEM